MPRGISRANANRAIRQEALREQLSNQKHVEKVVDNINKIEDLNEELDALAIQRLRAATEARLKLIGKYLPDLKATELTGPDGESLDLVRKVELTIVDPQAKGS